MKYLFLMFYRYYSDGNETKSTAYISALGAISIFIFIFILNICKVFKIDFEIMFWGQNVLLNYLLIGIVLLPINISFFLLFPPKKVKKMNLSFKYKPLKNVFYISLFIIMFFMLFVKY